MIGRQPGAIVLTSRRPFCSKSDDGRGGRALDDVGDGHRLHVPFELAGLDLREVQHVVDQLGEPFAFADDDLEVVFDLLDGLRDLAIVGRARAGRCGPPAAS